MAQTDIFQKLPSALLMWYADHKRDLPWRQDREPYHIWVSEIMLQQTRVEAVKGYYERFLKAVPTLDALVNADDELLHKLWEGLGYYSRVRNLKKAAQQIMEQYDGRFPEDYGAILNLPGIGEYTAGAICSIAFNKGTPAVDGNVLRVVSRLTNDSAPIDSPQYKKTVRERLAAIYPAEAGEFTQALMELGATVCGPNRLPVCENCPCNAFCLARKNGTAANLPVKTPKKQRKQEDYTVFVLCFDGKYALQKRPLSGLLASLWQFPNVVGKLTLDEAMNKVREMGLKPKDICRSIERKHIFTHIQWNMRAYYMDVANDNRDYIWMAPQQISDEAALPTAFRQFWEEIYV